MAENKEVKDAAVKAAEALAALPTQEEVAKQIKELEAKKQEIERAGDLKLNYGLGKTGKKRFNLPPLPRGLGHVTINNVLMEGLHDLTHEQFTNWKSIYDGRLNHERELRLANNMHLVELASFGRTTAEGEGVKIGKTGEYSKF